MIVSTVHGLVAGRLKGTPQDENEVTYASKLDKSLEKLDINLRAEELDQRVRALNPWPGTSVTFEHLGRVKIKRAVCVKGTYANKGEMIEKQGSLYLTTRDGLLELLELQEDGKKAVSAKEFTNRILGAGLQFPIPVKSS